MKKISIAWLPFYPERKASSRIRVYTLHKEVSTNSLFQTKYISRIFNKYTKINSNYDIIIIQKYEFFRRKEQENFLSFLNKEKNRNTFLIYDFDDPFRVNSFFNNMISYFNLITTDTENRKNFFDTLNTNKTCEVIEDCIDYYPEKPLPPTSFNNVLSIFGNKRRTPTILWGLECLKNSPYKIHLITAIKNKELMNKFPNLKMIQWTLNNFVDELRKTSMCFLSQGLTKNIRFPIYKSNNRMIAAITYGIPCIVNRSESYIKLAKKFNLDYAIVKNCKELTMAIEYLNYYQNRVKYLENIQPYVWEKYNSHTIVLKLLNLIAENI